MSTEALLGFEPADLIFQLEPNKQLSSSIRLWNKTENHVFYKLLTTSPKKYGVKPRIGVLLPGSVCDIAVTTRAMADVPHNMRSKDRFMIQSVVARPGATAEDARNMFNKEAGNIFQKWQLRVVYCRPESSSSGSAEIEDPPNVPEVTTSPDVGPDDNVTETSPMKLLDIQPSQLEVPLNPEKDYSCLLQFSNVTGNHVAFRVKTMSPKYVVQPNIGSLSPQSTFDMTVKMQVEVPSDVQGEDKFIIQSMVGAAASTTDNIKEMFDNASSPIQESEVRVVSISNHENNTAAQADEVILWGVIACLLVWGIYYAMKRTLSWIWSLVMVVLVVTVKMIKKLVTDSVEDWVVKTLFYLIMYMLGRKQSL